MSSHRRASAYSTAAVNVTICEATNFSVLVGCGVMPMASMTAISGTASSGAPMGKIE